MSFVYAADLLSHLPSSATHHPSKTHPLSRMLLDSALPRSHNEFAIYCPNPNCQSVILRPTQAFSQTLPPIAPNLPSLPSTIPFSNERPPFWFEISDKMTFENIGFSKPADPSSDMRYLSCADCDIGPLGFTNNDVSYLDPYRLRYPKAESDHKKKTLKF